MNLLLFTLYLAFFSWMLTTFSFITNSGLKSTWLLGLFFIKVCCGVLYGYLYSQPQYVQSSDTWQIYYESLKEYQSLLHDPRHFFSTWQTDAQRLNFGDFTDSPHSYWNALKDNLLIKAEAMLNALSGGLYYNNVVLYSFITFFGSVAFYRTIRQVYTHNEKAQVIVSFLFPSFLFWTSGVYKDGLLFLFMALAVFHIHSMLCRQKASVSGLLVTGVCISLIFFLRTYLAVLFVPAMVCWVVSASSKKRTGVVFAGLYASLVLLTLLSTLPSSPFNVPRLMSSWQRAFLLLPANSYLQASRLEPTAWGLLRNFPQAINFGFLRPYLWDKKGLQYIPYAIEIVISCCMVIRFCLQKTPQTKQQAAFTCFCFFLAFSAWLLLGYLVNIIGALIRYKSIYYPFLLAPLLGVFNRRHSN